MSDICVAMDVRQPEVVGYRPARIYERTESSRRLDDWRINLQKFPFILGIAEITSTSKRRQKSARILRAEQAA